MQASMHMMVDALGDEVAEQRLGIQAKKICIEAVFPYPEDGALQANVLYVVDGAADAAGEAKRMTPLWPCVDAPIVFFVVAGSVPDWLLESDSASYVRLQPEISANRALTETIAVFRMFGEWHARLTEELLHSRDLNRLCHIGSELIGHPIMIYDRNYAVLGNSLGEDDAFMAGMLERRSSYYVTTPDMLNALMRSKAFQETFATRGAAVFHDPGFDSSTRSLYVNLGRGAGYEGRIVIPYTEGDIPEGDFQAAEIFADVVRLALRQPSLQHDDLDRVFRIYLVALIEGRAVEGRQLDDSLRLWNWERTARYLCLWAQLSRATIESEGDAYLILKLELALPGSCAVRYKDGIACVAPIGDDVSEDEAQRLFGEVLGGFAAGMGSSNPYDDVLLTGEYFTEARIACDLGLQRKTAGEDARIGADRPTRFADVALAHYHAYGTSRLSAIHFCDKHVRALLPYRGTQRDFYNTCKVYLEHNMNLLHASEALFIHRTTLFKHLKEIRAITGADLDDIPTRLRMFASFEILER